MNSNMWWREKKSYLILLSLLIGGITACQETPEEQYIRMEEKELESGIRYDSLFRGIHFKMEKKEFMDYCFNMNLQDEFRQGGIRSGSWVECKLIDELKYPAAINFFPKFRDNKITEMEAAIYYDNVRMGTQVPKGDSLLHDVLQLMEKWYGTGFMKIDSPYFYKDDVYVKVDGNRRITLYKDASGHLINIWYVDLTAKPRGNE